ncbi:MAG TPA: oxygen-independent coproporphyrinogen III oxidase [Synechococcales cyanobacterium M55_K2018_004]|nr:oxygen-independent coproporphyrinogen III oxidase [Synechococcales cyanobacterium M55_K2018_004]
MNRSLPAVQFDPALLRQYDQPLPRYTSYPPATELKPDFQVGDFQRALLLGNAAKTPLSLYCHIPFCETACYFCGCNTVITQRREMADTYLEYLVQHIRQVSQLIDGDRPVTQLHWGGGTPNYLSLEQVEILWNALHDHFQFAPEAEISIEVNPRYLDRNYVLWLRDLGFNRISFGIQDFNPQVQEAVNRVQPETLLFNVMDWIRTAGFESVNVDLIYGLPYQTLQTFQDTVQKTIELDPDRIAVFNFAYVPWMKPLQRKISQETLPPSAEKLEILHMTIDELTRERYQFIGMDHFAKPDDELAIAQREGRLHRNFQGYTTQPESDLIGFGMTSISMLQDVYVQNHKRLSDFNRAIAEETLPIERGVRLHVDDLIRRAIIMELMCQFQLSKAAIQAQYLSDFNQEFDEYFAAEQADLQRLAQDGLIELTSSHIQVTPAGRLLIRNIASVFDTYLRNKITANFSRSI